VVFLGSGRDSGPVNEIEDWLREHGEELAAISRHSEVGPGMVHMLTVLILGRLEDEQILEELRAHLVERDGRRDVLHGVPKVMHQIRELAAADAA